VEHAVVAVIRRAGRVLVIQRGPRATLAGYWCLPSGRIEPGETQAQTVVREMREELGLVVRPLAKIWQCPTDDGRFLLHWWTVAEDGSDPTPDPAEVTATQWVTAAEFLELDPTFEGDRPFFRDVLPTLD
jgi:8-oxo-dGTP diphosphatase